MLATSVIYSRFHAESRFSCVFPELGHKRGTPPDLGGGGMAGTLQVPSHQDPAAWYHTPMQHAELDALARRHFPAARPVIILPAGDPGGMLFHDAAAELQAAGIAATSWQAATGTLSLRRMPERPAPPPALSSRDR